MFRSKLRQILLAGVVLLGVVPAVGCGPAGMDEDESGSMAQGLVAGCTANQLLNGQRVWLHFANKDSPCLSSASGFTSATGRDLNILAELKRLIDATPAGGVIKGHLYEVPVQALGSALLNAQNRGVAVYLSADPQVGASTNSVKTTYLDHITHMVYCAGDNGCLSTYTGTAYAHTKAFTFAKAASGVPSGSGITGGIPSPSGVLYGYVAWFGSANVSYGSGSDMFNNAVSVYGSADLAGKLNAYLDDLRNQVQFAQYYDPTIPRGYWTAGSGTYFASPSPNTDLVVQALNEITPASSGCVVRVMQAYINDSRLAPVDKLVAMKNGGCQVYVVAGSVQPTALSKLKGAGIVVKQKSLHDKVITVYGNYSGTQEYHVYTGSHNWGSSNNDVNDELFIKLAAEPQSADATTRPVYNNYYDHFYDAYNAGTTL